MASLLDLLPPEYQHLVGAIAAAAALVGLLLWAAGLKTGRVLSALGAGGIAAAFGAWLGASALGLSPYTGGLVGLVAGLLIGALGYRMLLPLALACVLSGAYLRWQSPAAEAGSQPAATVAASELQIDIHSSTSPASGPVNEPGAPVKAFHEAVRQWRSLPGSTQTRVALLFFGTLTAGIVLCLLMFRRAAVVITAMLGSLLLYVGLRTTLHVYARPAAGWIPTDNAPRLLLLGLLTALGIAMQFYFFREAKPVKKVRAKPPVSPPAPAGEKK